MWHEERLHKFRSPWFYPFFPSVYLFYLPNSHNSPTTPPLGNFTQLHQGIENPVAQIRTTESLVLKVESKIQPAETHVGVVLFRQANQTKLARLEPTDVRLDLWASVSSFRHPPNTLTSFLLPRWGRTTSSSTAWIRLAAQRLAFETPRWHYRHDNSYIQNLHQTDDRLSIRHLPSFKGRKRPSAGKCSAWTAATAI